jgi:TRAP-type C4-dicarboxylate transport system permease small subunit
MKKFLHYLNKFEDIFSSLFLLIMCVAVFIQIIGRVIIKKPLLFTEEVARFSYIWCVYLLIPMGEKYEDHFSVDIFVKFLKGKASTALFIIEKGIGCVMFGSLFVWSISFFKFQKVLVSPAFGASMGVVAFSMCVGFFLAFIRRGTHLVRYVQELINPTSSEANTNAVGEDVS